MSRGFENIFEKYNITSDFFRKRHKKFNLTQSQTVRKRQLQLEEVSVIQKNGSADFTSLSTPNKRKSLNVNTSCYYNTKATRKYYKPTRYKTLEIVPDENVKKHFNCSRTGFPLKENANACVDEQNNKEKYNKQVSINSEITEMQSKCTPAQHELSTASNSLSNTKNYLLDNFNMSESDQICNNRVNNKCLSSIVKQTKLKWGTLNNSGNFLTEPFQHFGDNTGNRKTSTQPDKSTCTELDALIDLIQREEKNKKVEERERNGKLLNCDDDLPRRKQCLKGGYEELFQTALKHEKVKGNFLKYDKKTGLRVGLSLTVINIATSYDLTVATVKSEHLNKNFAIVVAKEIVPQLKLGGRIEAFFDDNSHAYKLQVNGESIDIYLEPYKLLVE